MYTLQYRKKHTYSYSNTSFLQVWGGESWHEIILMVNKYATIKMTKKIPPVTHQRNLQCFQKNIIHFQLMKMWNRRQ